MNTLKKFKCGFDFIGFLLFAFIMLPNIYSMIVPPPSDFFGAASVTPMIDTVMSVSQYIMIASLCILINTQADKIKFNPPIALTVLLSAMYWAAWLICYLGVWNFWVMLALCVFPCAAFILYIIDRKNYIALPFSVIFAVLHIARSVINFIQ